MKIYNFFFVKIVLIFLLCSCSYFDQEKDSVLPGKRESVFINYERIDPEVIRKIAFNSEYDDIFVCNKYLRFQIGEHQDTPDDVFEDIIKDDEGHLTEEQKEMLIEKRK